MNKREMDKIVQEVKDRLGIAPTREEKCNKCIWIALGVSVVVALVAVVLWIKSKEDEDIEEYYEYFDDELDDDIYDEIADDSDDDVEYMELKTFDQDEEDEEEVEDEE